MITSGFSYSAAPVRSSPKPDGAGVCSSPSSLPSGEQTRRRRPPPSRLPRSRKSQPAFHAVVRGHPGRGRQGTPGSCFNRAPTLQPASGHPGCPGIPPDRRLRPATAPAGLARRLTPTSTGDQMAAHVPFRSVEAQMGSPYADAALEQRAVLCFWRTSSRSFRSDRVVLVPVPFTPRVTRSTDGMGREGGWRSLTTNEGNRPGNALWTSRPNCTPAISVRLDRVESRTRRPASS